VKKILKSSFECNRPCLIGIDYDEFRPETYRAVVIELPVGERRFAGADFDADLAAALLWFAQEQPTQVLAFRSSVLHFFQDRPGQVSRFHVSDRACGSIGHDGEQDGERNQDPLAPKDRTLRWRRVEIIVVGNHHAPLKAAAILAREGARSMRAIGGSSGEMFRAGRTGQ